MKNRLLILISVMFLLALPIVFSSGEAIEDQRYDSGGASAGNIATVQDIWQSFTVNRTGNFTNVSVFLREQGTPTDITEFLLYNTTSSLPDLLLENLTIIRADQLTTSFLLYNVSGNFPLVEGVVYAIVAHSANIDGDNHQWGRENADNYANGECGTGDGSLGGFAGAVKDCGFVTWINSTDAGPPPPPDTTNPSANITNQNASDTIRFGDLLNISAFLEDDVGLDFGNFTFNITGPINLLNFSFLGLSGTTAVISQNITISLTRGNVINATVYVTDTSGNRGENSTLITIANSDPTVPDIVNISGQFFNTNITINITPSTDNDQDTLTYFWYRNQTGSPIPVLVGFGVGTTNITTEIEDGDGAYYYFVNVSDGVVNVTGEIWNLTIDTTLPILLTFNMTNNTVFRFNINVTLNITVQDTNPHNLSYTLYNASKEIITTFNDVLNTSTTITIIETLNLTGLASGNYSLALNFSDRHTAQRIKDYTISTNPNGFTFNTAEGSEITILQTVGNSNEIKTTKKIDRYTLEFGTSSDIEMRKYLVTSDQEIKIIENSGFKGHLIIGKNWMDFENGDATSSISIERLGKNMVMVTVNSRDFNFRSLGGLNVVNVFYNFQVDNHPPTSSISVNDTTPTINTVVNISANASDIIGISTIFIGHNNSGSWVNASNSTVDNNSTFFVNLDLLLTVTAAEGQTVGVLSCANDTSNIFSCGTEKTFQVNDTTVPTIVSGDNVTRVLIEQVFNFTYNVTDNFLLSTGQVIITENSITRFFNTSLAGTSFEFSQNFSVSGTIGSTINITGRVNDSFGNLAQTTTLLSITRDFGVNASNLYDNTSILAFTAVLFNSTFQETQTTTDGNISFDDIINGNYILNISSDENGGYHNLTNITVTVTNNFEARMHQAFVYFTAVRRGTNINVTAFNVSVPLAANQSNSTGGLRLLVNATRLVGVGTSDDYFDRTVNISPTNQSTLRVIIEFYDINVSISVDSTINNTFLKNFTISLTGNNTNFSEELTDQNTGNVTFSLGNNTYDIIIDAPDHALFFASFFIGSNDTFPNLTFSLSGANSINFSIFDEITEDLILGNETTIDLISETLALTVIINATAEGDGTLYVQDLIPGEYRITYDNPKYTKRDFYINVENSTNQSVDLYLLSIGNGTDVTFTVQDNSGNKLTNATIRLKRYYLSTNSYRTVAMSRTNEEGNTQIDVDFNDAFYETLTTFEGFSLRTIGAKIISTTRILTLQLTADPFSLIDGTDDITTTLSFNNITQTFSYVFTQLSGISTTGFLEVTFVKPTGSSLVCEATDTTSSGTLLCQVNTTNSTGTYTASGSVLIGNKKTQTNTLSEITGIVSKLADIIGEQGFFFAILISGSLAGLGSLVSPAIAVIMFLVGIFISNFLGFSIIAATWLGLFILITMAIVWKAKK